MTAGLEYGEELFSRGKLQEAMDHFAAFLKHSPNDPDALNDMAVVHLTLGNIDEAERYFQRAAMSNGGCMEAHVNLADFYVSQDRFIEAIPHLEKALESMPENPGLIVKLCRAYARAGRMDDGRALLESSRSMSLARRIIDATWAAVRYWELEGDLTVRERLEALALTIFSTIDGDGGPNIPFKLVAEEPDGGVSVVQNLAETLRYRSEESDLVRRMMLERSDSRGLVLEPGPGPDWEFFREKLKREMKEEGGCLGDYTQCKKVLRREKRLERYNVEKTLRFFEENLGPCDCHVYRSVLV